MDFSKISAKITFPLNVNDPTKKFTSQQVQDIRKVSFSQ
jgi:hypothetical protein